MKTLNFFLLIILGLLIWQPCLAAQPVDLYFFRGEGCPVCAQTQIFLGQLSAKYSELKIRNFEVFYNQANKSVYFSLGQAYNLDLKEIPVPVILIGEKSFVGYNSAIATNIEQTVVKCLGKGCISPIEKLETPDAEASQKKTSKNLISWFAPLLIILILIFLFKKRKV